MQGLLLSAPASNQGKTVVSVGLLALLRQRLGADRVVGAKAGPDYIDTAYLGDGQRRLALSLDPWAMRPQAIQELLVHRDESHLLVEGTMGLFDGSADRGRGSSADLAAMLGLPVVLVVDVRGASQSVAALVGGFASHRADVSMAGVILNRVGSDRHKQMLVEALAPLGLPVLGAIPRDAALHLDERHLGLVQAGEHRAVAQIQSDLAAALAPHVDLDAIEAAFTPVKRSSSQADQSRPILPARQRLAIADDPAFRFCYGHWRRSCGHQVKTFSPLADQPVPGDVDFIFLPGGYPELHLETLAKADRFWCSLKQAAEAGVTIYGECGGYMCLGESITDANGKRFAAAGLLPVSTSFERPKRALGYRQLECLHGESWLAQGAQLKGHEFHYCQVVEQDQPNYLTARDARGQDQGTHGHVQGSVSGSFMHLIDWA